MSHHALERIRALMGVRRYAEAEAQLRAHLSQSPDDAAAMRLLADALSDLERYPESAEAASRAVALDPENEWGHRVLCNALIRTGDSERAVASAQRAVHLAPWSWATHYTLGMALRTGRRPRSRDALACANEAVRLAPNSSDAHNLAGLCLDDLKLSDEARTAYEAALRLDPHNALALNNLAATEMRSGKLGAASRFLTSGLTNDPQQKILHRNYDVILFQLVRRLWFALLALGAVLSVMAGARAPYAVRAVTGLALLAVYALLTLRVTRDLPRGTHLWARGLLRRANFGQIVLLVGFAALSVAVLALGFAPRNAGIAVGVGALAVLRLLGLGVILVAVGNLVAGPFRRKK